MGNTVSQAWETWETGVRWETSGKQLDTEALLREGWTPRLRYVKDKAFITLRFKGARKPVDTCIIIKFLSV